MKFVRVLQVQVLFALGLILGEESSKCARPITRVNGMTPFRAKLTSTLRNELIDEVTEPTDKTIPYKCINLEDVMMIHVENGFIICGRLSLCFACASLKNGSCRLLVLRRGAHLPCSWLSLYLLIIRGKRNPKRIIDCYNLAMSLLGGIGVHPKQQQLSQWIITQRIQQLTQASIWGFWKSTRQDF